MRPVAALIAAALIAPASMAQALLLEGQASDKDVLVEAVRDGDDSGPVMRAVWRNVRGAAAEASFQRLRPALAGERIMLDRLLEAAIGAYLDAQLHFTRDGVRADAPAEQLVRDINAMAAAALEAGSAEVAFHGLSAPAMDQLQRLARLDWSQAAHGINASGDERYLGIYRFVRLQRQELERQLRADLLPLAAVPVLAPDRLAIGAQVRINSTCGTVYDADNYLCALDLQLADSGSALDPGLAAGLMEGGRAADAAVRRSDAPVRRRDRWLKQELDALNGRIDRLDQRKELWALRDRMDDIEDRMTGLEIGLRDAQQAAAQPGDNPSASLALLTGRNLLIRFDRNSVRLEPDQQLLLNEVFEQLARAPQNKVLITGYTDRSGDAARNLWLSEQRAKAVRGYLMARGIGAERLLVNFYGDSRSLGRDPAERRVEIEWIR